MNSRKYIEDTTIKGRKEEIAIKVDRIKRLLESEKLDALYLTRQANFSWITAGSSNLVTICTEDGVASILVTKDGKKYALTNAIEEASAREQLLEELGFEIISQAWYENRNVSLSKKS
jgi:Xaa-Pro aminopeptidase